MTPNRDFTRRLARIHRSIAAAGGIALLVGLSTAAIAEERLKVEAMSVDDTKEVLATIESVRAPQARARIGGTVDTLAVVEGASVKRGDVLAVVIDPKLKLQLAAYDARIGALEAKVQLTETELQRVRQLRLTGAAPQSRLDDAETQMTVIRAEIAAVRADKAVVEEQMAEGRVVAPDDGRILKVQAIAGQVIMPGEPVATMATANYILKLRLPERHARSMHQGDKVMVAARGQDTASSDALIDGKIVRVYPELDQGRVVADAEATSIGDYFVGERVRVLVSTGKRSTFAVPRRFVTQKGGLTFVRLAGLGEVPVQLGAPIRETGAGEDRVEILSGLSAGDTVVAP